jgi:hypothetical protein
MCGLEIVNGKGDGQGLNLPRNGQPLALGAD